MNLLTGLIMERRSMMALWSTRILLPHPTTLKCQHRSPRGSLAQYTISEEVRSLAEQIDHFQSSDTNIPGTMQMSDYFARSGNLQEKDGEAEETLYKMTEERRKAETKRVLNGESQKIPPAAGLQTSSSSLGPPRCQRRLLSLSSAARRGTNATLLPG